MIVDEKIDKGAESNDKKSNGGNSDATIRTKDVDLFYGDFQALFKVSVDIKPGIITSPLALQVVEKQPFLDLLIELMKGTVTSPLMEL